MATVGDLAALSNWAYDPSSKALQAIGNGNLADVGGSTDIVVMVLAQP
jgi:hypothetical protein